MSLKNELRNNTILKFIQDNEPCTFGEIKKELMRKKLFYKVAKNNNKPLSRELEKLIPEKITRDVNAKPYPTYSIVQDYSIDNSIMGESFRENYGDTYFTCLVEIGGDYMKNDIPLESWESDNEKFIKSMVVRYGFYILSMLIKSYEQTITRKHFDRKIWIQNAMDLLKDEEKISESFLTLLDLPFDYPKEKNVIYPDEIEDAVDIVDHPELDYDPEVEGQPEYVDDEYIDRLNSSSQLDLTKGKNKQILKKKLKDLRNTMDAMYPKLHQSVNLYDIYVEKNPKKIKSSDFKKIDIKK